MWAVEEEHQNSLISSRWSSVYKVIVGILSLVISTLHTNSCVFTMLPSVCTGSEKLSVCPSLSLLSMRRYLTVSLILVLQFRTCYPTLDIPRPADVWQIYALNSNGAEHLFPPTLTWKVTQMVQREISKHQMTLWVHVYRRK